MITGIYLMYFLTVFHLFMAVELTVYVVHRQIQRTSAWNTGLMLLTFHRLNLIVLAFQFQFHVGILPFEELTKHLISLNV